MDLHKLIQRQINKHLDESTRTLPDVKAFIEAVNASYRSYERDKEIMTHAFTQSEAEYMEVNKDLNRQNEQTRLSIEKIKQSIRQVQGAGHEAIDIDGQGLLPVVDYLNQEISKRQGAEENLSRTLHLLTTLLTNLHSGILLEDENRRIIFTNQLFCDLFSIRHQPDEMTGADCSQSAEQSKALFKDPEAFVNLISRLLREKKKELNNEMEMINGTVLQLDYVPVFIGEKYLGHLWDYTDITERKRNERNLLNITNVQHTILNGTNYSIIYTDVDGLIRSFNKGAEDMLGYKASEIVGKHTPAIFHSRKEVEERAAQLSLELKRQIEPGFEVFVAKSRNGIVDTQEWIYITREGKELTVLLSVSSIRDAGGSIIGYLGIARDISEQKLAEKALHLTEERYKNIVEKSSDIIYKTNRYGYFTFVNPVAQRITGYSEEELLQMNYVELIREDYKKKSSRFYVRQVKNKIPSTYFEFPITTARGQEIWIGQSVQLSLNDAGETELIALAIDITKQKQNEKEILETNQKLQLFLSLINNTSDAIQVSTEDGHLVYMNNEATRRLGIRPENIGDYSVKDIELIFSDPNKWQEHVTDLKKHGLITIEGENVNQLNGARFPVEVTVRYITINKTGYIIANSRDITARKNTEKLLRTQEEKYRNIIANMHLGLLEVDLEERIQYFNQGFLAMSGYTSQELIGRKASDLFLKGENKEILKKKNESRLSGHSDMYEIRLKDKRGEMRWWMISGAPNYNDQGTLIGSIGIHLDITEQKKLELELEESKYRAEEASKAKESFLANMSHEIRTPLNAIKGMIRELQKETLSEKQRSYVENSFSATRHLLSIVNNILDISKIEAGELNIEHEHFVLKKSFESVMTMLNPRAAEKGIFLKYEIAPGINDVLVGDSLRIEQILLNLVSNAIKFTPMGGVSISCSLLKDEDKKQKIEISVNDTGIGMDGEYLKTIFSKFSQEDISISRRFGGTGLGMAITYELVHLMHGSIEVKSEKGLGTTFYVRLVLNKGSEQNLKITVQPSSGQNLSGAEILLVEDNDMNRLVAQNTLKDFGCNITEAVNGIDAIEKLSVKKFDIILMDIQMPEMDGIEATKIIRNQLMLKTPIIALTANAFKTEIELCKTVGMNDYVTKPFEESKLIDALSRFRTLHYEPSENNTRQDSPEKTLRLYDLTSLRQTSRGDEDFVKKMTSLFVKQTKDVIRQLTLAVAEKNYISVSKLAHKIKPSLDNMGVLALKEKIRRLESEAATTTDKRQVDTLVDEVLLVLREVCDQLQNP